MITGMRGCVAYNDLWPWPISSRSFGLGLENLVRSVASVVLDGFFPYLVQIITSMRRCRMWWPLILTYIFKVIRLWLRKSHPLCSIYSSGWILFIYGTNDHAIQRFKDDLSNSCISSVLNPNLMTDPNIEFEKFEKIVSSYFDKHFPEKTIKVNKYRHKLSKWITSGIIKSIEFRDKLYKCLKTCEHNNPEYERLKHNL